MAAAAAAQASESNDGPVLSVINKRLRALKKKQNRILQMEESLAQGKTLNKEQEETLRSKPAVVANIDELEKLRAPLAQAVSQEIAQALEQNRNPEPEPETQKADEPEPEKIGLENESGIPDLLNLLYFGNIFDVKLLMRAHENMLTRTHERNCCLTYDYVTDDDAADPLKEWDLDLISMLQELVISRPVDSSLSHKNALEKCIEHAKLWLSNSDQLIGNSGVTYSALREKLSKIMASDYFTTTPQMKAPVEVAAAAGNYTSFQVPVHHPGVGLDVSVQVEGSGVDYQQEVEGVANSHENEIYDDQSGPAEENHQEEPEVENLAELPAQTELAALETDMEHNSRELESKEQQHYGPRRQYYRGGRGGGGGRRTYQNGRGGRGYGRGGYQNGRNQSYDQPGGYYPRNNYNYRGRGGRGVPGNYNHHGGHSGYVQAES